MQKIAFRRLVGENCMKKTVPNYTILTGFDIEEIQAILFNSRDYSMLTKIKSEIRDSLTPKEQYFSLFLLTRLIKINLVISTELKGPFEKQYDFDKGSKTLTLYRLKLVRYHIRSIFNVPIETK
jgi:hypothetical protein